jgi:DNA-binding MarR family transcriptional regulator
MSLDSIVVNPGRLRILTALAVEERQEFVHLRTRTQLTDGNLSAHAKRLHSAGMIDVDKQFRDGKPVTHFMLTAAGRQALETHARRLLAAISHRRVGTATTPPTPQASAVRAVEPATIPAEAPVLTAAQATATATATDDDWVD